MKVWILAALGVLVLAAVLRAQPGSPLCVSVPLPPDWRAAARVTLVLGGLTLPANRSAVFRVVTTDSSGQEVFLGSLGMVGVSPTATGQARHETLRVNVTSSLARWAADNPSATDVRVCVEPVDSARRPISDMPWSIGGVTIDLQ
jgi:hypothetical protein